MSPLDSELARQSRANNHTTPRVASCLVTIQSARSRTSREFTNQPFTSIPSLTEVASSSQAPRIAKRLKCKSGWIPTRWFSTFSKRLKSQKEKGWKVNRSAQWRLWRHIIKWWCGLQGDGGVTLCFWSATIPRSFISSRLDTPGRYFRKSTLSYNFAAKIWPRNTESDLWKPYDFPCELRL